MVSKLRFILTHSPSFSQKGIIGAFILFPILTLPYIIKESINRRYIFQVLLCVFLGLLSVLSWPPRADTYRHAMDFYEMQRLSLSETFNSFYRGGDFIVLIGSYIFGKLGLSFELLRFFLMTSAYIIAIYLYNNLITHNIFKYEPTYFIFYMCIFMVPFYDICYAIRYGLSLMCVSAYIILYYVINRKKIRDYIFLILGFSIHWGSLWLIGLAFFGRFLPNKCPKWIIFIVFICCLIGTRYSTEIIAFIGGMYYDPHTVAFYTIQLSERFIEHNLIGTILEYIRNIPLLLFIILGIFCIPYSKKTKIFFLIIFMWAFTYDLWEINRRIGLAITILGPIMICSLKRFRYTVVIILSISYLLSILFLWRQFTISNIIFIFAPLPISIFQSYNYDWLKENVLSEGTLKVYNR